MVHFHHKSITNPTLSPEDKLIQALLNCKAALADLRDSATPMQMTKHENSKTLLHKHRPHFMTTILRHHQLWGWQKYNHSMLLLPSPPCRRFLRPPRPTPPVFRGCLLRPVLPPVQPLHVTHRYNNEAYTRPLGLCTTPPNHLHPAPTPRFTTVARHHPPYAAPQQKTHHSHKNNCPTMQILHTTSVQAVFAICLTNLRTKLHMHLPSLTLPAENSSTTDNSSGIPNTRLPVAAADKFGRLDQGIGNCIKGTNTIHFIHECNIPKQCWHTAASYVPSNPRKQTPTEHILWWAATNVTIQMQFPCQQPTCLLPKSSSTASYLHRAYASWLWTFQTFTLWHHSFDMNTSTSNSLTFHKTSSRPTNFKKNSTRQTWYLWL